MAVFFKVSVSVFLCRTCLYVLGLISKTRLGCDTLKQQGWDAVRQSRGSLWPVALEELEPQLKPYNLLSSVTINRSTTSTQTARLQTSESNPSSEVKQCIDYCVNCHCAVCRCA